jgi:hypothetical protein
VRYAHPCNLKTNGLLRHISRFWSAFAQILYSTPRTLRGPLQKLSYIQKRLFYLVVTFGILTSFTACVPATQTSVRHLEFFFSDEIWGGSPFSEAQRKDLFVAALKTRGSERISKEVPFETADTSVTVKRFSALYEVNANIGLPKVRSGYVLELSISDPLLERVTLTNTLTGVSWSITLNDQSNQSNQDE